MSPRPGCSLNQLSSHGKSTSKANVFERVLEQEEDVAEVGAAEAAEHQKAEDVAKDEEAAARAAEGCDPTLRRPEPWPRRFRACCMRTRTRPYRSASLRRRPLVVRRTSGRRGATQTSMLQLSPLPFHPSANFCKIRCSPITYRCSRHRYFSYRKCHTADPIEFG